MATIAYSFRFAAINSLLPLPETPPLSPLRTSFLASRNINSFCPGRSSIFTPYPFLCFSCSDFVKGSIFFRLRIWHAQSSTPKVVVWAKAVSCSAEDDLELSSESDSSSSSDISSQSGAATIDIKLPRRSLLVQFTCNECGHRTQRLVNRLAYERGTVFVQCAGCLQHHKLVDNLGLVVEYDFREETGLNEGQVPPESTR
ncbi:hypothetical protein QQ045_019570 [Rhodiola kirilowii]